MNKNLLDDSTFLTWHKSILAKLEAISEVAQGATGVDDCEEKQEPGVVQEAEKIADEVFGRADGKS